MRNIDLIGNSVRRQIASMFDVYRNTEDLDRFRVLEAIKCLAKTFVQIRYTREILNWSDAMASDYMYERDLLARDIDDDDYVSLTDFIND